jgi:hypothetical protein
MTKTNKLLAFGLPALLAALCGCSGHIGSFRNLPILNGYFQSAVSEARSIVPRSNSSNPAKVYHAYGASVAAGYTLKNPSIEAYPAVIAKAEQIELDNYGIPGAQACDMYPKEILKHLDSPTLASHIAYTYTLQVGTNDVNHKGAGAYESTYMRCHQAAIAWLALPLEYKVLANSSGVQTSGPGKLDKSSSGIAWTTAGNGASVSFSINTVHDGPIYAWPLMDNNNRATYTVSLDGKDIESTSVQPNPQMATKFGTTRSLGFLRISGVNAGSHVVKFTQTSSGTDGVSVIGIATPDGPSSDKLPTVLVGSITYQLHGNYGYACNLTDDPCLQYNKDIQADVDLFAQDGLNVRFFDTRKYLKGASSEMNDPLHPNAFGQQEIAKSAEEVW